MMNNIIRALEELEELTDKGFPILIEHHNCMWTTEADTVIWNTDNNREDMFNQDGDTYVGEMVEGCQETDNYFITNVDTQTDTWITVIFDQDKYVDYEELLKEFD